MTTLVGMGANVELADDQRPLGSSFAEVLETAPDGSVTSELIPIDQPGMAVDVEHFVLFTDGTRVSVPAARAHLPSGAGRAAFEAEVAEVVLEEEYEDIREEADLGPRWNEMLDALKAVGIAADVPMLAALPFTVELSPQVVARL